MSMVFAGFMAARKEDRLRQEKIDLDNKRIQEDRDWQLKLRDLTAYDAQKKKDDELAKNVDWFMSSYKIESKFRPSIAQYVENIGLNETMELFNDGKLQFGDGPKIDTSQYTAEFDRLTSQYNLPEGYLVTTGMLESKLNPMAKNSASSAEGLFQFTDKTAEAYGVDKFDWKSSADGAARLAKDNYNNLQQMLGRPPTAAELYLAHQQGATGAANLILQPTKLAKDIVGSDAVRLNGGKLDMTAEEFGQLWVDKYQAEERSGLAGMTAQPSGVTIGRGAGRTFRDYAEKATGYGTTLNQIAIAKAEGADDTVIKGLEDLLEDHKRQKVEMANIENGVNPAGTMEAIVTDENGERSVQLVTFDATGKAFIDGKEVNAKKMPENMMEMFFKVPSQTQKTAKDYVDGSVALAEGLINAQNLVDIAERNPGVVGLEGDISQAIVGFVRGGSAFVKVGNDLFDAKEDPENAHITLEEYENELRKQGMYSGDKSLADMTTAEMVDSLVSTTTVELARDTTLFEAQMVALAFRVGRLEGQSGNAMSNKDFERIQEMVGNSNGDPEAFREQLHEFMRQKIKSNDMRVQGFNTSASGYGQFEQVYKILPYKKPQTIADLATEQEDEELLRAIDFFRNPYAAPTVTETSEPVVEPVQGDDPVTPEEPVEAAAEVEVIEEEPAVTGPLYPVKDKVEWANNVTDYYYWDTLLQNIAQLEENNPEVLPDFLAAFAKTISEDHGIEITAFDLSKMTEGR